jgi:peptide/nickel transport system substrate-binding protein
MAPRRLVPALLSLAVAGGLTAACGSPAAAPGSTSGSPTVTLTVVEPAAPESLNPVKANVGSDNWYVNLAYDPLLRLNPDGTLGPDLAVKWGYVGAGNRVFDLTLRPGVKFSDGAPLTAKAVAASLNYARSEGLNVSWTAAMSSITATGPLTVQIDCSSPDPIIPFLLNQIAMLGSPISPAGLADPNAMGTRSFGAGPYVLDTSATVPNDYYTYTPNPYYWDKSKIHWKKVVLKIDSNPSSALDAVETGEAELVGITANQVGAAQSAGLSIVDTPIAFTGVNLAERSSGPLAIIDVREALNYAVNRAAISNAIFGKFGAPTDEISLPGLNGFAANYDAHYSYDPAKAKQLLAQAGYPHGFTLNAEVQGIEGLDLVPEAVFQEWKQIGVTVNVTTDTTIGGWLSDVMSRKFPAMGFGYGGNTTYLLAQDWMLPHATAFNPFATSNPTLTSMLATAAAASPAQQPVLYQDAMRYLIDQAWFVSVAREDDIEAYNAKALTGVDLGPGYITDLAWTVAPK